VRRRAPECWAKDLRDLGQQMMVLSLNKRLLRDLRYDAAVMADEAIELAVRVGLMLVEASGR
jgi:hypothetical protein